MKTKLLALAIAALTTMSYGQKNEIKAIEKALKSGDFANAKTLSTNAESIVSNGDDKYKAKYYFLKAKAFYADGSTKSISDFKTAIDAFSKVNTLEGGAGKYSAEAQVISSKLESSLVNSAVEDQNAKRYTQACEKLYLAYNSTEKANKEYLYYSAYNAVNADDNEKGLDYFLELKNSGYTGIETIYKAKEKKSGKDIEFSSKEEFNLMKKSDGYTGFKIEKTESKLPTIIKVITELYIKTGKNEEALANVLDARKENPKDLNLLLTEADLYKKLDRQDDYIKSLEAALIQDPTNHVIPFIIGYTHADKGNSDKAMEYYKKSVNIKPDYFEANFNIGAIMMNDSQQLVGQMNDNLSNYKKYDALKLKLDKSLNGALPYFLKAHEAKNKDASTLQSLFNIYSNLADTANYKKYKGIYDSLTE